MHSILRVVAAWLLAGLMVSGCGKPAPSSPESSASPTPVPEDPRAIKVGIFLPMTGAKEGFGRATLAGAELAVEQINTAGGVLDRPLKLVVEDTRSEPGQAAAAVKILAGKGVYALIGEVTSEATLEAAPAAVEAGLPLIVPAATHPDVTKAGPMVFRISYVDPFPAVVMSKFAFSIGAVRAGVLYDPEDPYSALLSDSFTKDFTARGGSVVVVEKYAPATSDFSPQLTALKAGRPEIIFLPGYFAEAAAIIKQARVAGIDVPFLGTDGWESEAFLKAGGEEVDNCYFASHFSVEEKSDRTRQFVEAFHKKTGAPPAALAALGYDAVNFLADGIRRAGSLEPEALGAALSATRDLTGVTGSLVPDDSRNPRKSAIVLRVEDGKFTYLETVNP
jgi:branched-chain amino acid transport system substrate-binding protein